MENKVFEIRDEGTFIPALAVRIEGNDGYLLRRAGFDGPSVYLIHLEGAECSYDPYDWGNRTMQTAHSYIEEHWTELANDAVIDVQFILGETPAPKESERVTA